MASTVQRTCRNKQCGALFTARTADVKRGWALFCSKSCKAIKQEQRTGQYAAYQQRRRDNEFHPDNLSQEERDHRAAMDDAEWGWDGHKIWI